MPNEPEYIASLSNLDNLAEMDEQLAIDLQADANAALQPIPAGQYVGRVSYAEADPEKRWRRSMTEKGDVFLMTFVQFTVTEGDYEGRTVSAVATSLVSRSRGTNAFQALAQGTGFRDEFDGLVRHTPKTEADLVDKILLSEPMVGAEVEWEARERPDDIEPGKKPWRTRGMKRFPKDPNGEGYIPQTQSPGGVELSAYNIIRRWIPASEMGEQAVEEAPVVQAPPKQVAKHTRTAPRTPPRPAMAGKR